MTTTVERLQAELVQDARAGLGEGPVWDERTRRLYWLDVPGHMLHRFDPATRTDAPVSFEPADIGAIAPREPGGWVAAVGTGFGFLDEDSGSVDVLEELEDAEVTVMNDGKPDPAGRFWAGTYARDEDAGLTIGALYRLDPDGGTSRHLGELGISNGMGWSPDGRVMYFVDSVTKRVEAFDFEPGSGSISGRRTLAEIEGDGVVPDGLSVDADGCVWVGCWGGSRVERYSPAGELLAVVDVAATYVTSCAFGGDGLADLYVTTAAWDRAESEPQAGGLFHVRPGVAGLPVARFAG
jgi:sugar lactone lactonase YvrE